MAFVAAFAFKFNATFNLSINSVVLAHANIVARMEFSTTLTNDDAASGYQLGVMSFGTQTLCVRVTTVVGATSTFLCACNCRIISNITFTSYVLECEHIVDTDALLIPLHKSWFAI